MEGVIDVDVRCLCSWGKRTLVLSFLETFEKYLARVLCRSTKVELFATNHSRVPQASEVKSEFSIVVGAELLAKHFADAVDSLGMLGFINWRHLFSEFAAEGSN